MKNYKYIYTSNIMQSLFNRYLVLFANDPEMAAQELADKLGTRASLVKTHMRGRTSPSDQVLIRMVLLDAQFAANDSFDLKDDDRYKRTTLLWDRLVFENKPESVADSDD